MRTLKTDPDKAVFASGNGWAECWIELQTLSSNSRKATICLGRAHMAIYFISLRGSCEVISVCLKFA